MRSFSPTRTHLVATLVLILSPALGFGQENAIHWRAESETLIRQDASNTQDTLRRLARRTQSRHVVVQFNEPVTPEQRAEMRAAGLELLNYVGSNAFFASLHTDHLDIDKIAQAAWRPAVAGVERGWKLHPDLSAGIVHDWSVVSRSKEQPDDPEQLIVAAYVLFHADVQLDPQGLILARRLGARVQSVLESVNGLVIELPYASIPTLTDHDMVMWVEPPLPKMSELNNDNRLRTGADIVQAAPYGLDGSGITVMVYDGGHGLDSHQDFGGRLTTRDTSGLSDHATHVAGTVGGSGAGSGGTYRGMAPAVTIESYGFEQDGGLQQGFLYTDPGDLEEDYNEAINTFGADISNNSIGTNTAPNGFPCEWEGNYGVTGNLIDAVVRGSLGEPFRVVWANGNERQVSTCFGVEGFPGEYHTTAPPACAKNHITVGALNSNDDSVTGFTSWGPCDDGRLKPDISAPGCQSNDDFDVTSCSSGGGYTGKCGTSMASPTVCGLSALLLQDYRAQFPGEPDFRNSTLKTILAHTAEDIENPGPDYMTGYGSVRIEPAINLMRDENFIEDTLDQGQTYSFLVLVGPGDPELKVTLAWDDAPGTPNVDPVLVNDLDLRVFDPGSVQHFPWTLDLNVPSADAVRTQPDHINNIEQVVIDAPAAGVYRVDVVGFNIPQGPQPFSVTASPQLVACSSAGIIALDRPKYACSSSATVRVVDCDLNTDDGVVESLSVTLFSDSEPAGEVILLTETAAETAAFEGTIPMETVDAAGTLLIADGDTLSVSYTDADDGQGGMGVVVTANAVVDCQPPAVSNVQTIDIEPRSATVTFDTDESANGTVQYGLACDSLTESVGESGFDTAHDIPLSGLDDDTTYFYVVEVVDEAGNATVADAGGGACFTFSTPEVPDFFTEEFSGDNDLDNTSILFTPNGSVDFYAACSESTSGLPIDPAGGTVLSLGDDESELVTLAGGETVSLYGVTYSSFHVGSNGYITFNSGSGDWTETLDEHFGQPRISLLYDDISPNQSGTISWLQLSDRVVVTYDAVTEYQAGNANTFQVEMLFSGDIRMSYADVAASDGICGLSEGEGLSPDFFESDLSDAGFCGPRPPTASGAQVAVGQDTEVLIALNAADDGLPDPPAAITYIVTSLPAQPLRDAGTDAVITVVPHTLTGGANEVIYAPTGGFFGADSFQFKANDGGVPPEGGDSTTATVNIQVEPLLELPFFDDFPSGTFDPNKWATVDGATIDGVGLAEPSAPNSARFNGEPNSGDLIESVGLNLAPHDAVRLSYHWQRTGGGDGPEAGDDLFVEYRDSGGSWQLLIQHSGGGADMVSFDKNDIMLPAGALHSAFRLRFRNQGTAGLFDDWFVDDVSVVPANAPLASNQEVATPLATPFDIVLEAIDPNNDPLDYVIMSLPANGALSDPGGGSIGAVPYTLLAGGDTVHYTPAPLSFQGNDTFDFMASDGTNDSNTATVDITVGGPQPVYSFLVDDLDPGWDTTGGWGFGVPAGVSGDPSSGNTGSHVCGYNLAGDYSDNMPEEYLTSTMIDCSTLVDVEVRFWRWLGVEQAAFDHARFQVSTDQALWTTIWENPSGTGNSIDESNWTQHAYDISAIADNQPELYLRWIMGPTDGSVIFHGWNLDDIQIWAIDESAGCKIFSECADLDGDSIRDDNCVWWACNANLCEGTDIVFADMGGSNGSCTPDGTADSNDRFHALNCFSNTDTFGNPLAYPCEVSPPSAFNVDASGEFGSCPPDGVCDGNDAFAAINAFEGNTTCSCPSGGPMPGAPIDPPISETTRVVLEPAVQRVAPGSVVEIDVLLDGALSDLRGYQLHAGVSGGRYGALELIDMQIRPAGGKLATRSGVPPLFDGLGPWTAFNVQTAQMVAGLDGAGIATPRQAYLVTLTYRAGDDAAGAFLVDVLYDNSGGALRTFLFPTRPDTRIAIESASPAIIEIDGTRKQLRDNR